MKGNRIYLRTILVLVTFLFFSHIAFAEVNYEGMVSIPSNSLWGMSITDFLKESTSTYEECTIGHYSGLCERDVIVASYKMDSYYVFANGLSKIVYALKDNENMSANELNECFISLTTDMTSLVGDPDSVTKSVATWNKDHYTIQIGKARINKYTGTDSLNIVIVFEGKTPFVQKSSVEHAEAITNSDFVFCWMDKKSISYQIKTLVINIVVLIKLVMLFQTIRMVVLQLTEVYTF